MKLRILFLFLLFITLSYSQQACVDESDCTNGPDDPICQSATPECLDSVCVYDSIPNCCHDDTDCAGVVLGACESGYICNMDTNQCEAQLKECENGQPCTDYCLDDQLTCTSRICVASPDPDIDSTCQIGTVDFECEKPTNKCMSTWCAYGYGCESYDGCSDYLGCTTDTCPDGDVGCEHTPIDNCIECDSQGCITVDACFPSICVPYEFNRRGGGPIAECKIVPVNCTIDDPCLINGECMNGVCEYENICSSESEAVTTGDITTVTTTGPVTTTASTVATTASTLATTTSQTTTGSLTTATASVTTTASTVATTASTLATTTSQTTTGSTTTGGSDSDDYHGPKYPDCLDCRDLDCEKMGKKCKYLKSEKKPCVDEHHRHRKQPKPVCSLKCPPNHQCKIDKDDKQCCVKIECDDVCNLNCGRGYECKIKHDGSQCCVKVHRPRPPPPPRCSLRCPPNHQCKVDEFGKQCCVKIDCDDICDLNCGRGYECKIKHDGSQCCVRSERPHNLDYELDYNNNYAKANNEEDDDYYNGQGGNYYEDDDFEDDYDEQFITYKHKKYPRRLGPYDCCPYTPTCY
ncbi:hypothetical protein ACTA71_001511 [Dictyostelium dimigraforme]